MRFGPRVRATCLALLLVGAWLAVAAPAPVAPKHVSVLILLPGQPGLPAATAIASAIRSVLLTEWSFRVSIEMEHVDVGRFASVQDQENQLRTLYRSKYGRSHFDVIIAALPEPFQFVLRARDELWPGTPVVVCGVDERSVRDLTPPPGFAVLTIRFDMEGTVRAAMALLPDTRHVALVGGASRSEQVYHDLIRQAVAGAGGVDIIDLTTLPVADVLARVATLPEHTVVVQSSYQVDGAGRRFYGIDLVPHVAQAANRPVFTPLGLAVGRGVVGGSIVEFEDMGRDAGMLASRIVRGERPPAQPLPSWASSVPRFDARELRRWRLDDRRLPADSVVLFQAPRLWQQYRREVVAATALFAGQAALIVALLVQRRRRREAQAVLAGRLRFEALVSEIITACTTVPLDQLDDRIRDCLRRVATFLDVDRGRLWQRTSESAVLSVTHFWQRDGTPPLPATRSLDIFAYFRTRTDAGDIVCFTNPKELPPEAMAERIAFEQNGVRSFAAIPLRSDERALGFLVFLTLQSERPWPFHVVQQLRTLAEPFATALIRVQS